MSESRNNRTIIGIDPASENGDECSVCVAQRDNEGNTNIIFHQSYPPTYQELGLKSPSGKLAPLTEKRYEWAGILGPKKEIKIRKKINMIKRQSPWNSQESIEVTTGNFEIETDALLDALKAKGQLEAINELIVGLCASHGKGNFNRGAATSELLIVLIKAMDNEIAQFRKDYRELDARYDALSEISNSRSREIYDLERKLKAARARKRK